MRESKFRGYSDYHKMWYYGSLVKIHKRYYIYNTYGNRFQVVPESIGEYTGLKDKNGKEIYEGDICSVDGGENIYEIIFYMGGFMVAVLPRKIRIYHIGDSLFNNIEVIGNIHEDPELLK